MDKNGWSVVAEFASEASAHIACGMLRNHGIEAMVTGAENMATLYGAGSTWAPIELCVPTADAEQTMTLLNEHE